ncbi:60S ribosome subunit biogenesis protein NIP7 homolog isoform X2 [Hippopotamus amphibius kiboko]|uniref:60S ribosome subunit biogenesis protein NIP7 homolog isoform X2 n=1 Tax=Hippopotamus amphibius kiboko TaxID=575201 RepID=UPI002597A5E8|nr:60S ribosome subunit biogenesis protein NIP7 homolog isoform X2 [Hippopotamus amphibius kiboko]
MRPLTEEETRVMFEKIAKYIGENLQLLVDRPDGTYCFRLHNDRVYYVSEKILKLAANISGDKLVSLGTCFGKFTKTHKFRLHITALDYLAPYAKYKVWIKPGAEQSFLYGNHVLKSGLGRITENTSQYQGVVVYSMADIPLCHSSTQRAPSNNVRAKDHVRSAQTLLSHHMEINQASKTQTKIIF